MPGIEAAQGKITRVGKNSPERVRCLAAYYYSKDKGKSGARKVYGGVLEFFLEKYFAAYFNVPIVPKTGQSEAKGVIETTNAYSSTNRAGLEFTATGTTVAVEKYTRAKDLVLKTAPAGKRIIIPSQEVRTVKVGAKEYYVAKTASCTVPRWFSVHMCLQLMGTMIKAKFPLRLRIGDKRYDWRKYEIGQHKEASGIIADSGAWILTAEFKDSDLPMVSSENTLAPYHMNM